MMVAQHNIYNLICILRGASVPAPPLTAVQWITTHTVCISANILCTQLLHLRYGVSWLHITTCLTSKYVHYWWSIIIYIPTGNNTVIVQHKVRYSFLQNTLFSLTVNV